MTFAARRMSIMNTNVPPSNASNRRASLIAGAGNVMEAMASAGGIRIIMDFL